MTKVKNNPNDPRKLILVVDDEKNIRLLFQQELEEEGYKVILAESGEEALQIIEDTTPDLITMDMRLPGISGLETLQKIKEKKKHIPVIICSGFPNYQDDFASWLSEAYIVKTGYQGLDALKTKIAELVK